MGILNYIELLSGIALFLYGVMLMGNGLNKAAGDKLELVLYKLTGNPFKGLALGAGVTALIQSSSAASVMVVGFVNAEMMSFLQAVYIILGSILGTSVTCWITSLSMLGTGGGWLDLFSSAAITGIVAIIGIYFCKFSKKKGAASLGEILMGFAVLMFGMSEMSAAVVPLRESETFLSAMKSFSNPVLGFLIGMVFTCIIQSSAAAVGVLQALSVTGVIDFEIAFPFILGIAVGGAVPVLLSALGAQTNGKRTALVHLLFDIFGALGCGIIFYVANAIFRFGFMEEVLSPVGVAVVNTLFRLAAVIILFPLVKYICKIAELFIRDKKTANPLEKNDSELEERFLAHPALAIEQSRNEVNKMALIVEQHILDGLQLVGNYTKEGFDEIESTEQVVDGYEDRLGVFLNKISVNRLTQSEAGDVYRFIQSITDLERISDHALNLAESAKEMSEKKVNFSENATKEMRVIFDAVSEICSITVGAFVNSDIAEASKIEPLEEVIDGLCDEIKANHAERVGAGACTIQQGFVFNDIIMNLERVSDHCSNIGLSIMEYSGFGPGSEARRHVDKLSLTEDPAFKSNYNHFKDKYHFA